MLLLLLMLMLGHRHAVAEPSGATQPADAELTLDELVQILPELSEPDLKELVDNVRSARFDPTFDEDDAEYPLEEYSYDYGVTDNQKKSLTIALNSDMTKSLTTATAALLFAGLAYYAGTKQAGTTEEEEVVPSTFSKRKLRDEEILDALPGPPPVKPTGPPFVPKLPPNTMKRPAPGILAKLGKFSLSNLFRPRATQPRPAKKSSKLPPMHRFLGKKPIRKIKNYVKEIFDPKTQIKKGYALFDPQALGTNNKDKFNTRKLFSPGPTKAAHPVRPTSQRKAIQPAKGGLTNQVWLQPSKVASPSQSLASSFDGNLTNPPPAIGLDQYMQQVKEMNENAVKASVTANVSNKQEDLMTSDGFIDDQMNLPFLQGGQILTSEAEVQKQQKISSESVSAESEIAEGSNYSDEDDSEDLTYPDYFGWNEELEALKSLQQFDFARVDGESGEFVDEQEQKQPSLEWVKKLETPLTEPDWVTKPGTPPASVDNLDFTPEFPETDGKVEFPFTAEEEDSFDSLPSSSLLNSKTASPQFNSLPSSPLLSRNSYQSTEANRNHAKDNEGLRTESNILRHEVEPKEDSSAPSSISEVEDQYQDVYDYYEDYSQYFPGDIEKIAQEEPQAQASEPTQEPKSFTTTPFAEIVEVFTTSATTAKPTTARSTLARATTASSSGKGGVREIPLGNLQIFLTPATLSQTSKDDKKSEGSFKPTKESKNFLSLVMEEMGRKGTQLEDLSNPLELSAKDKTVEELSKPMELSANPQYEYEYEYYYER